MTLNLEFFKSADSEKPYQTKSFDISCRTPPPLRCTASWSKGRFHDCTFVEASLSSFSSEENVKGRYRLQLAYKPDHMPISDGEGDFFCENKNKEKVYRLQLFRGACGMSFVRLLYRVSTAADWTERFSFEVEVEPSVEKRAALEGMVDELLQGSPHEVLSRLEGLSKAPIERRWERGRAPSEWGSTLVRYEEMHKLFDMLKPMLELLRKRHSISLIRGFDRRPVSGLRRVIPISRRDMEKRSANQNPKARVLCPIVLQSEDIPIHRGIKGFLLRFKRELTEVLKVVQKSIGRDCDNLEELGRESEKHPNIWDIESKREEIEIKEWIAESIRGIQGRCASFLSEVYPWARSNPVSPMTIGADQIPANETYRRVYAEMLRFAKKQFLSDVIEGNFLVPQYVRCSDGGPSLWQKNYSYIYESWVFARLLQAFEQEGFNGLSDKYRERSRRMLRDLNLGSVTNEPICAEMVKGGMRIDMFHGLYAVKPKDGDKWAEFTSITKRETPDFVIVFTNLKSQSEQYHDFHWLVLDAKSGRVLDENARQKQGEYGKKFLRNMERPDQSWLIYSGDYRGEAGVEFRKEDNAGRLSWDDERGIEGWSPRNVYAEGALRANVRSVLENDVFRIFARGQIATARRRLGLSTQEGDDSEHGAEASVSEEVATLSRELN